MDTPLWRRFAAPRYWPVWLGLVSMIALARLPLRLQRGLGRCLGYFAFMLARRRRRIADINLRLCFPELTEREQGKLLRAHFAALGIGLFETAAAWWAPDEPLRPLGQVEGLEHLDRALERGKGVILLTGHFTTLEMGARFITFHRPFHAMYRPHRNELYQTVMRRERERRSRRPPITRDDVRGMLRALRQGHAVWYAPDQNAGRQAPLVPFFKIPAATLTAASRLARVSGAAVVPYFPQRLPGSAGYRVTILPALDNFPSGDEETDALRVNQLLETWVRQMPEQYLWVHRRFKRRGKSAVDVYRTANVQ